MKKILAFLLAFLVCMSVFASVPAHKAEAATYTTGTYKITASSGLRLRSGAGTSYSTLATIPNGTTVSVTQISGVWGKTTYSGNTGWISLDYASKVTSSSTGTGSSDSGTSGSTSINVIGALAELRVKFPDGKYWNKYGKPAADLDGWTDTPCPSPHSTYGTKYCQGQCAGYADKIGLDIFSKKTSTWNKKYSIADLYIGDIIRYNSKHSIVVTGFDEDGYILVTDCNWTYDCQIDWDRYFSTDRYISTVNYVYHYPGNNFKSTDSTKYLTGDFSDTIGKVTIGFNASMNDFASSGDYYDAMYEAYDGIKLYSTAGGSSVNGIALSGDAFYCYDKKTVGGKDWYKIKLNKVYAWVSELYGEFEKNANYMVKAEITKQPANVTVKIGETASTAVYANGDGLKYAWYICDPGYTSFSKSSTVKNTYSFEMTSAKSGRKVYCIVTDEYGNSVKSNTVTLKAEEYASITKQPANASALSGETVSATVSAKGDGLTYQWYICDKGYSTYSKSSITKATYSYEMTSSKSGRKAYCVITDKYGNSVKSNTVTFTMKSALKITGQPVSAKVASGKTVSTTVTATGDGLKYQWYIKDTGFTEYSKSSITSATYSYVMTSAKSGRKAYCVITDKYGNTVKTNTVTLSLESYAKITKQPSNASAAVGKTVSTTVTATGDGLKYQWYIKDTGYSSYSKSSITSATYSFTMTSEKSGRKAYCVIVDKYGNSVKTNVVTLSAN